MRRSEACAESWYNENRTGELVRREAGVKHSTAAAHIQTCGKMLGQAYPHCTAIDS